MALEIPLYPPHPMRASLSASAVQGLAPDRGCTRCDYHKNSKSVCITPEIVPPASGRAPRPGGILVVGENPTREDDSRSRPFTSQMGSYLRPLLLKDRPADVDLILDLAVKCAPFPVGHLRVFDQCRPYLQGTIAQHYPSRIITLGKDAAASVLGRSVDPSASRKSHSWLPVPCGCAALPPEEVAQQGGCPDCGDSGMALIPVFPLPDPRNGAQNRFLRGYFEEDLKHALTFQPPLPYVRAGVAKVVRTPEDAHQAEQELRRAPWFAFDCEWAGKIYNRSWKLLSLACTPKGADFAWVWDAVSLASPMLVAPLRRCMEDPKVGKAGHFLQSDIQASAQGIRARIPEAAVYFDSCYAMSLQDPECGASLEEGAELVGMGGHKEENEWYLRSAIADFRKYVKDKHDASIRAVNRRAQVSLFAPMGPRELDPLVRWPDMTAALLSELEAAVLEGQDIADLKTWAFALVPRDILSRYNALDTIATAKLVELLEARFLAGPWPLRYTWKENVLPLVYTFARIEEWGIEGDRDNILLMRDWLTTKKNALLEHFRPYGWDPDKTKSKLNLDSPPQMAQLLYETLRDDKGQKLKCSGLTDGGERGTGADALEALEGQHPLIAILVEFRRVSTQLKKDLLGYLRDDGRFHTRFNLNGARSGRVSSQDPNLQNQKRAEDEEGIMVRSCFTARAGYTLLDFDQAQVELRTGAGLCGDPKMIQIFKDGRDFHMEAAKLVAPVRWGITADQVTEQHRQDNKPTTFAVFYDDEVYGLAFRLGVPVEEAEKILTGLFGAFVRLPRWIGEQVAKGEKDGGVWSWWNGRPCRWRPLPGLGWPHGREAPTKKLYKTARRGCWNSPNQATANEFVLAAIRKIVKWIEEEGYDTTDAIRLVLTVHDSVLLEVRDDLIDLVCFMVYRLMTSFRTPGDVPLDVDCKRGKVWGAMEKYKFPKPKDLGHLNYDEPESYPERARVRAALKMARAAQVDSGNTFTTTTAVIDAALTPKESDRE